MRQRVVTALLLALPALLALALRTPWPLAALGLAAAVVGGLEASRLVGLQPLRGATVSTTAFVLGVLLFAKGALDDSGLRAGASVACALTVIGALAATRRTHRFVSPFAGLWTSAPLLAVLALHLRAAGTGPWCLSPALMALVPVWAGDIAAIFAGRKFGRHPLVPGISPKKTVEGAIANLGAALLAAWLLGRLLGLPQGRSLGAGLAIGVLGQAGDLFESGLKRRAGVKDSGTLLPGHGGVLDRIDSVLFAAPAVALILLA